MLRIVLAGRLDDAAEARLAAGAEVVRVAPDDGAALLRAVADCDALIVRTNVQVTRELLAAGRRLRCVGVAGVGIDNVDAEAAAALGITVLHTPEASSDAVAEFTVALMLQLLRPIPRLAGEYAAGRYTSARAQTHGRELRGLTVGIIGMGRIGSRVGRICGAGLGARVLYNDIVPVGPFDFPAEAMGKRELLAAAEVLTLHVPLTAETRSMLSAGELSRLRPGVLLINTARGGLVDLDGLLAALKSGHIGGAALDVTEPEPLPAGHELFSMPNCILTPHAAARTTAGIQGMYAIADRVLDFLAGRPPA